VPKRRRLSQFGLLFIQRPRLGYSRKARKQGRSLITRTLSSAPKRTSAIHGSGAEFPDRVFMLDEPAFGLLVRIPAKISI
jgi:hypothetical protein